MDSFQENIDAVANLVGSDMNKTNEGSDVLEGVEEEIDLLALDMEDDELLRLKEEYERKHEEYYPKVKTRQQANKIYYLGHQKNKDGEHKVVASNLIFESEETFIPQALSKNPEPVVWSDNTPEGKEASNKIKTMLQYHADVLCLRRKLGVMVRHWSIYFTGVVKHGWDPKTKDIKLDIRKPQNFVLDPDGYVDEYGNYIGAFLGERREVKADKLIEQYPDKKDYILIKCDGKLGSKLTATEWWTDEYSFTTFMDAVLDKHKNEFFNYGEGETDSATPTLNHFSTPKMPYTFLSVFSLQERPHDITNLIEQNIPNQDNITERDDQINKNLKSANNSVILSGLAFTSETAGQARDSFYEEGFLLVPNGDVEKAVKRLPANEVPQSVFKAQENDKEALRSVFGVQGLSPSPNDQAETARGAILNQSHDSTRIGGGIGDALEQVADNIFNWWLQLYCVFYDEPHYGAIMGNGQAVEYVSIIQADLIRKFVVSVAPNSMAPKDEVSEMNTAIELWKGKALDPITLFQKLNYPDPMESAKKAALWTTNPQLYMMTYFPEQAAAGPTNNGPIPPQEGTEPPTLGAPPASSSLSNVPLNSPPQ